MKVSICQETNSGMECITSSRTCLDRLAARRRREYVHIHRTDTLDYRIFHRFDRDEWVSQTYRGR